MDYKDMETAYNETIVGQYPMTLIHASGGQLNLILKTDIYNIHKWYAVTKDAITELVFEEGGNRLVDPDSTVLAAVRKQMDDAILEMEAQLLIAEFNYWDRECKFLNGEISIADYVKGLYPDAL